MGIGFYSSPGSNAVSWLCFPTCDGSQQQQGGQCPWREHHSAAQDEASKVENLEQAPFGSG